MQTEPKRDVPALVRGLGRFIRVHLQGAPPAHGAGQSHLVPMCAQEGLTDRDSNTARPHGLRTQRPPPASEGPCSATGPHGLCSKTGEFISSFSPLIICRVRRDHSAPKCSFCICLRATWKNGKVNSPLVC